MSANDIRDKIAEALCESTTSGRMFPWHSLSESDRDAWRRMVDTAGVAWREACTVTTVADLDALPDRTVIIDADDTVLRRNPWHSESPVKWYPFDGDEPYERDFGITAEDVTLPARVIHNPDWEGK